MVIALLAISKPNKDQEFWMSEGDFGNHSSLCTSPYILKDPQEFFGFIFGESCFNSELSIC